jgi:class 3 adenylate cyclase/predicted ATPase
VAQPGEKFCGECGAALGTPPAVAGKSDEPQIRIAGTSPAPENLEGERKTITVLFADIKGSMSQIEDLDPETARAIVDPALAIMAEAVNRYQGHVAQSTGDGVFALFGAPIAQEDHPQRAIYAALRMQEELRRYSGRLRADGKAPVEIRIGINTGEVVMRSVGKDQSHSEYLPAGHAVGLASRLQTVAPARSIALSEHTRGLVEGYFQLKSLGATPIKGISEAVNVYEVIGLGPLRTRLQLSASRGLSRFVGRDAEIAQMKRAIERAKSGHGQVVAAMAEPGVGKSRLFFEFKAVAQSGCMVLEGFSISHGKTTAYLPVLELLRGYFKITGDDDSRARREKVNGKVLTLDPSLEDTIPYLFALLGIVDGEDPLGRMDGQSKKRRTLDAIKRIILRESLNQPLIVIFEDLHWFDEQTQEFLNLLVEAIANAKVLLLVNYRPEYHHEWGSKTYYIQLRLDPLGKGSADEMLSALLGDAVELVPLKRVILEKTEGNPFFMEETVQVLFDDGALMRNGAIKLAKPLTQFKIPHTVQAILASRIDRLPPHEKDLLHTLAIIGKEFPLGLARSVVARPEEDLEDLLSKLQLGEFIYEQPAIGDIEYTFKHALTHDVAYNSVLFEKRKLLHERVGAAIEALYQERLDDHLSALAHHYGQSRNTHKAIHYLRLAGAQAVQRSANHEAVSYFRRALEALESLADPEERTRQELDILLELGPALMMTTTSSAPDVRQVYARARQLAVDRGKLVELFVTVWGSWLVAYSSGDCTAQRKFIEELFHLARGQQDPGFLLQAHHAAWPTALDAGELAASLEHCEVGLTLYRKDEHRGHALVYGGHDPGVCGYHCAALLLQILGYPERALTRLNEGLALARELEHPPTRVHALSQAAETHFLRREPCIVLEVIEEWLPMVTAHGSAVGVANAMMLRGCALVADRQYDAGLADVRDGLRRWRATGSRALAPYRLARAAEAFRGAAHNEEALALLSEAIQAMETADHHGFEAELLRLKGSLLLETSAERRSEAEVWFARALEVARTQGARLFELRAAMSLARLRLDEGRAMLAEIYNWFTEGFDTADLKDARALLDELGGSP